MRSGRTIASRKVSGRVLTLALPHELVAALGADGVLRLSHPAGRSLAGRLTLPFIDDTSGRLELADLDVPSSGVFSQEDLQALWRAGRQLATWDVRAALAMTDGSGYAVPQVVGVGPVLSNWWALTSCARYATGMVARWPTSLDRELIWHAVGVPTGTEDLLATEREAEHRGRPPPTRRQVQRGAQCPLDWSAPSVDLRLGVGSGSPVVALAAATSPDIEDLRPILGPLAEVARLAEPPPGVTDLDASSWPPAFVGFVAAALPAIAELTSQARGDGAVPLLDTDELFEAWLAGEVIARLTARLGAPTDSEAGVVRWVTGIATVAVHIKPVISKATPLELGDRQFFAVGADRLIPDLLLSVEAEGTTRCAVLDAKAWTKMQAEQALAESAKYLYGVRSLAETEQQIVPVLESVTLVTSAAEPSLTAAALGRFGVVQAVPTSNPLVLDRVVTRVLDAMLPLAQVGQAPST